MSNIFIAVLNMSLTASYVAAVVILARLLLKKAPKVFSYALWAVVLFRLVCPFSFESILSILPAKSETIPQDIVTMQTPAINSGITFIDTPVNQTIQNVMPTVQPEANSINPMQIAVTVGTYLWLCGIIFMIGYAVISYIRIKRRIFAATLVRDNIFECEHIKTPFVIGFIKPKIYIPLGLDEKESDYIVGHEQTHIRRKDYLIKPFAYLALAAHWFNPLMWVSFTLMSKDMEMSCDESVMRRSGEDIRANYSKSLLSLSAKRSSLPNPLAFGESNVRARIKNVLNFKKRSRLIIAVAAILAVAVTVGCAMNRAATDNPTETQTDSFIKKDLEIGGYTISLELPERIAGRDYMTGSGELFYYNIQDENTVPIADDTAIAIGSVSLADLGDIPEEQFDYYKEKPEQNYRAVYSYLPMGSMTFWGTDYKVVYESEDLREGTATSLVYYRSDYLENIDYNMDISHFKEEIIEGDTRINYYNKGVLGYNLDLGKFVKIELYYDAVTDEELQHIAETLRITGEKGKAIENVETAESTALVVSDIPAESAPAVGTGDNQNQEYFDEYGFYWGRDIGNILSVVEMLQNLDKYNDNRIILYSGNPTDFKKNVISLSSSILNSNTGNSSLIKDMQTYCIIGNDADNKQAVDYPFPMPTQYGVYNFFADIKYNDNSEETIYFRVEMKEQIDAPRPAGLEEEVYRFIPFHHGYNIFMNNDELIPEINTFYVIYETYLLETAIGTKFDGDDWAWLIPVETVRNAVSYLYALDGESVQFDDFYINKDNLGYFDYPVGSPDTVWAFIQWDTLNVDNGVYKFDVIFYDSPTDDGDRGEELRTFSYKFEQVLYKNSSPSKTVCYKFIGATMVK